MRRCERTAEKLYERLYEKRIPWDYKKLMELFIWLVSHSYYTVTQVRNQLVLVGRRVCYPAYDIAISTVAKYLRKVSRKPHRPHFQAIRFWCREELQKRKQNPKPEFLNIPYDFWADIPKPLRGFSDLGSGQKRLLKQIVASEKTGITIKPGEQSIGRSLKRRLLVVRKNDRWYPTLTGKKLVQNHEENIVPESVEKVRNK